MPQKSETRAGARASRNYCGDSFRDAFSPSQLSEQHLPELIVFHIGIDWLSGWTAGRDMPAPARQSFMRQWRRRGMR